MLTDGPIPEILDFTITKISAVTVQILPLNAFMPVRAL